MLRSFTLMILCGRVGQRFFPAQLWDFLKLPLKLQVRNEGFVPSGIWFVFLILVPRLISEYINVNKISEESSALLSNLFALNTFIKQWWKHSCFVLIQKKKKNTYTVFQKMYVYIYVYMFLYIYRYFFPQRTEDFCTQNR